jgi:hypothetical protein
MTTGPETNNASHDQYWRVGFEDGQLGQTWSEHRRILAAEAAHEKNADVAALNRRLEAERAEDRIATREFLREQTRYDDAVRRLEDAQRDRGRYPAQYSRKLAWGFIVAAAGIMLADFPLAQSIAVQILEEEAGAFLHAPSVAVGIVSMGLFFKLLADPFMRPRYLLPKYLRGMSLLVTVLMAMVVALCLAVALGSLGVFRGNVRNASSGGASTDVVYGGAAATTPASAPPPNALTKVTDALDLDTARVTKFTFLTLALVLPMLGGIFISTGFARLHNRDQLERLTAAQPERETAYAATLRKHHEHKANMTSLEREVTAALEAPTFENSRYHQYLHGYERGLCTVPSSTERIAPQVVQFLHRWLAAARRRENYVRTEAVAAATPKKDS